MGAARAEYTLIIISSAKHGMYKGFGHRFRQNVGEVYSPPWNKKLFADVKWSNVLSSTKCSSNERSNVIILLITDESGMGNSQNHQ